MAAGSTNGVERAGRYVPESLLPLASVLALPLLLLLVVLLAVLVPVLLLPTGTATDTGCGTLICVEAMAEHEMLAVLSRAEVR